GWRPASTIARWCGPIRRRCRNRPDWNAARCRLRRGPPPGGQAAAARPGAWPSGKGPPGNMLRGKPPPASAARLARGGAGGRGQTTIGNSLTHARTPEPGMAEIKEARVPDIGDYSDVPVIEILVAVGDTVSQDQGLITLESDKATLEVPAPFAGVVKELK